jgi:hypothetical protein
VEQSPTTLNAAHSGNEVQMADFNVAVIESDPALRSQLIADLGERARVLRLTIGRSRRAPGRHANQRPRSVVRTPPDSRSSGSCGLVPRSAPC